MSFGKSSGSRGGDGDPSSSQARSTPGGSPAAEGNAPAPPTSFWNWFTGNNEKAAQESAVLDVLMKQAFPQSPPGTPAAPGALPIVPPSTPPFVSQPSPLRGPSLALPAGVIPDLPAPPPRIIQPPSIGLSIGNLLNPFLLPIRQQ